MKAKSWSALPLVPLLAGAALALPGLKAAEQADAFPAFESYIKISGQAASISGDGAAFQKRTQQPKNGGAGIEDLHYAKDLDPKTSLVFDGRALAGSEDYLAKLSLTKIDYASFEIGYKRFRTFYDGVGGFFPVNGAWLTLTPETLHLDRGSFWAEVKVNMPDRPAFGLRYVNETRNGRKDSTIWGDTDNTGQPYRTLNGGLVGTNNNATVRKNTPSYLQINERHESLEGTVTHTVGNTTIGLIVVDDRSTKLNGRYVTRFPGEQLLVTPTYTAITPAVGTAASQWATFQNQVQQSTYDGQDTKTDSVTGTALTVLSPTLTLRAGATYFDTDSDFSGDRMIVSNTPTGPKFVGGQPVTTTYNVKNLVGNATDRGYAANLGLECKATEHFTASLGFRYEDKRARSAGGFDVVATPNANLDLGGGVTPPAGTTVPITTHSIESSAINDRSLTPVLDLRYNGLKDLALYAVITWKSGDGREDETPPYNPALDPRVAIAASGNTPAQPANPLNQILSPTRFHSNVTEENREYVLGTNWRCSSAVTFRAEGFLKRHDYHSTGYNDNAIIGGIVPPAAPTLNNNYELDIKYWGTKVTAVVKPTATVTSTTRYIWQKGAMQVAGFLPTYPLYDAMDSTTHTIGETIDWNPTSQVYLQVNANIVFNEIVTAYPRGGSAAASGVIPANRFLQNATNDYTNGSALVGAVISKTDDLQVQYTTYRASNYNPLLALYTQPYGASASEESVTVAIKHKFSDSLLGTAKFGYIDSRNDTTGGRTNFRGPMGYVALEYRL